MFYRSDGGKYGFPMPPQDLDPDMDEEPIPDLEVERCLVALPSYLFAYLVRRAESLGLTESEYLTHFLIARIPEWDLIQAPHDLGPGMSPPPTQDDLDDVLDDLYQRFSGGTVTAPGLSEPVTVTYLVKKG
jgi:hypothetical protein